MVLDSLHQVGGASVVEEEYALPKTPKRSGSELIGACGALGDAVRKAFPHVVDEKVGPQVRRLIGHGGARDR